MAKARFGIMMTDSKQMRSPVFQTRHQMRQRVFAWTCLWFCMWLVMSGCSKVKFQAPTGVEKSNTCSEDITVPCAKTPSVPVHETLYTKATSKVDILFVLDTSGSMDDERAALGKRLADFTSQLSGLDWQICVTTTDPDEEKGNLLPFPTDPRSYVLTPSTPDYDQLFLDRMVDAPEGTGDEQAIHSLNLAIAKGHPNCFRDDAALATIIMSDEDERSTGGYPEFIDHKQYYPLEDINRPATLIQAVKDAWNDQKVFTAHSIVIQSGDVACRDAQKTDHTFAFYGTHYEALSRMTGGIVGSICSLDYAGELKNFAENIRSTLSAVTLKCVPIEQPKITVTPLPPGVSVTTRGNKILFSPELPTGTAVVVDYLCPGNAIAVQ